jgi:endonuclease III
VNPQKRQAIFARFRAANPQPRTELIYASAFELLVAVILSAQATDKSVNKATAELFRTANTPAAVLELGIKGLSKYIKSIGLYNAKAKNLVAMSHLLLERHAGEVPTTREALEELPGVGRKTANAILANAFGQPAIVVDTHTWRLSQRLGLTTKDNPDKIEADLVAIVPRKEWTKFCHLLQFHGRRVCMARNPNCPNCSISKHCPWAGKTKAK